MDWKRQLRGRWKPEMKDGVKLLGVLEAGLMSGYQLGKRSGGE